MPHSGVALRSRLAKFYSRDDFPRLVVLLGLGVVAFGFFLIFLATTVRTVRQHDVDCTPEAFAELGGGQHVHVSGCDVAFEDTLVESLDDEAQTVLIPLYPSDRRGAYPLAFLTTEDRALIDALESTHDTTEAVLRRHVQLDPITGMTGRVYLSEDERLGGGDRGEPPESFIQIREGARPGGGRWGGMAITGVLALSLLGSATLAWRRGGRV